ncbi:hypothetical protein [Fuerstiella marisgermanici]|uniref:PEP-CTERM protein-sorting domain-containing protein n=1 Tax=Fuerstiella marisgermanici TaxID=1891926 RepID=A0A1P8WGN4_9PLAN|nr:hypothetical protein [Fuerstiella marisgermanici]APZ93203.1 hypothetical protein Fuma_02820 [Fuerstiella marisgermanici]
MNVSGITQASWAIRSGVSAGNGGTLIAGGTSGATQMLTGRPGNPYSSEFKIEVAGLNVALAPGRYWLSVSPVVGDAGSGVLASYNTATFKDNSIGEPFTNNDNSFLFWSANTTNFAPRSLDFSMGIAGTPVPEPGPATLLTGIFIAAMAGHRRRRSRLTFSTNASIPDKELVDGNGLAQN